MPNQNRVSAPSIVPGSPQPKRPPYHGIPSHTQWSPYEPEELREDEHTHLTGALTRDEAGQLIDSLEGLTDQVEHEADRDEIVRTVRTFAQAMRDRIGKLSAQNPSSTSVPTTGTRDKS